MKSNIRNETYSIYPDQVYPFHIGYRCHKGHRKIPRQFDQQVLLQQLVCSRGYNHNLLHYHGIHSCHNFAEVNRKMVIRGQLWKCLGFQVGFLTAQESATFQDKGTEIPSFSRDKGTTGHAKNLARGQDGPGQPMLPQLSLLPPLDHKEAIGALGYPIDTKLED